MSVPATLELDAQYRLMREGAGLLDRSARGKLHVVGADAAEYLQGQLTNDVESLEPGGGCYAALLDRKGHMQADLRILRTASDAFWIDTEAEAKNALLRHLETYRIGRSVEVEDVGDAWAVSSLIGPEAAEILGVACGAPPGFPLPGEHVHRELQVSGIRCRSVGTDLGLDLICPTADSEATRAALLDAGAAEVSEAAAEILRVESGRPRYGAEMTRETIPQEAGINERAVSFTKGCYIGQETVARLHYKGKPNRDLRGLRLDSAARAADPVFHADREVGRIGTAVISPRLGPIALAIVRREAAPGDRVEVGEERVGAEVTELPFPRSGKR